MEKTHAGLVFCCCGWL